MGFLLGSVLLRITSLKCKTDVKLCRLSHEETEIARILYDCEVIACQRMMHLDYAGVIASVPANKIIRFARSINLNWDF